jgi:hypothetical protein
MVGPSIDGGQVGDQTRAFHRITRDRQHPDGLFCLLDGLFLATQCGIGQAEYVKDGATGSTARPAELVHRIREYRKIADSESLTLQGSDYAHAVQE